MHRTSRRFRTKEQEDEVLFAIERAKTGDESAINFLIEHVEPKIKELVLLSNRRLWVAGYDYDDIRQECHIFMLRALDLFDPTVNPSFRAYVGILFKGRIISLIKESGRLKSKALNLSSSMDETVMDDSTGKEFKMLDKLRDKSQEFYESVETRDYCEKLKTRLYDKLSKKEIEVFELFLAHHTYVEIADLLCINTKSVDNAIQRVKKKIALYMSDIVDFDKIIAPAATTPVRNKKYGKTS